MTPLLEVRHLHKQFGHLTVLEDVSLVVPRGGVVTIIGKSGTGKSVLLKCLAGVLTPDSGEICFDGHPLASDDPAALAAFRRRCSYLFQNNALLDSLNAYENVALPLEQATLMPKREIREKVGQALHRLELDGAAKQYPGQMSGGMQKRLALARAIVTDPELVLFDEPTAGLDPLRRNGVFEMIARHQREVGFTAVVVTHDVPEALAASDRVALLDAGRIRFAGTPAEFLACQDEAVRLFRDSPQALETAITSIRNGPTATPFS